MASYISYNNIIDILTDIANRHQQINTFYVGENWEIENDADIVYPVFQVYPTLAKLPRNAYGEYKTIQINMNCKVVGLTRQDNENEQDIYSDMLQVSQDIINELSQNPYFQNSNVSILNDISINPLNEFNDDYTNGWEWELSFQLINNNTWCGLPFDPIEGISYNGPVSTGYTYTNLFDCNDLIGCPIIIETEDRLTVLESILFTSNQLLTGTVNYLSGTTYDITPLTYLIQGIVYNVPLATQVVLLTGDTLYDRIDVIYADISGNTGVLIGEPADSPVKPIIDTLTQVELTFVSIPANSSTPAGVTTTLVYDEFTGPPTEWTFTTNAPTKISASATNAAYVGTKSIRFLAATTTNNFQMFAGTVFDATTQNTIQFAIKNNIAWPTGQQIRLNLYSIGGTQIGTTVTIANSTYGFSSTNLTTWQLINVPISAFAPSTSLIAYLRFTVFGTNGTNQLNTNIDYIRFITGTPTVATFPNWRYIKGDLATTIDATTPNNTLTISGGTNIGSRVTGTNTLVIDMDPNIRLTGLTATTISATTYQGLPTSNNFYTTGATISNNIAYFDRNDTLSAYTLNLSAFTSNDIYVTGGTYNPVNGTTTLLRNDGGTVVVSGYYTGATEYWTSGSTGSYSIKAVNDTTIDSTGNYSVAEGFNTLASGNYSHAENEATQALGESSHSEGNQTIAEGNYSHAEGINTWAFNANSHAEGSNTQALGESSHSEGTFTTAEGYSSHAEGQLTIAQANSSHAEGLSTTAIGDESHAEGYLTIANGIASHAEGTQTTTINQSSHAEGAATTAIGEASHAEGNGNISYGSGSHAEGYLDSKFGASIAIANGSHAEGSGTKAGALAFLGKSIINGVVTIETSYGDVLTNLYTSPNIDSVYLNDVDFDGMIGVVGNLTITGGTFNGTNTIIYLNTSDSLYDTGNGLYIFNQMKPFESTADMIIGYANHSEGSVTKAFGFNTHSEGSYTIALGDLSHAEGSGTIANGQASHSEGESTTANGYVSHTEGYFTQANGFSTHAEGALTTAIGDSSHSEGDTTTAIGQASHTEGNLTYAIGNYSHAEGQATTAEGYMSHSEGAFTKAIGNHSHSENYSTQSIGTSSHAEGSDSIAQGEASHAEGVYTTAVALASHSEGFQTIANNIYSHAEGQQTQALGESSHSENRKTIATGNYSHAEGNETTAIGIASHAEGNLTTATGAASHVEGFLTTSIGKASHAEGESTQAIGDSSHTEGSYTTSIGISSHAGGSNSIASGITSFVHGEYSQANGNGTIVLGNNLTGTTDNTVYVNKLNIKDVPAGTSINNIGIDINGDVIIGNIGVQSVTGINVDNTDPLNPVINPQTTIYSLGNNNYIDVNDTQIQIFTDDGLSSQDIIITAGDFQIDGESIVVFSDLPTKTSELINDGDDGISHFITLNDLPSNIFLYSTTATDVPTGYGVLVTSINDPDFDVTAVDVSTGPITTTAQPVGDLISAANIIVGNPGVFNVTTTGNIRKVSGSGTADFYFEAYKRDAGGTETLITTSVNTIPVTNTTYSQFSTTGLWNNGDFISTDRIVLKFHANRIAGGSDPVYEFQFGGGNPVRTLLPVPLTVIPSSYIFTGGTVTGPTNFTGGLTASTMTSTTYYGDGSNLTGISVPPSVNLFNYYNFI